MVAVSIPLLHSSLWLLDIRLAMVAVSIPLLHSSLVRRQDFLS